MDLIVNNFHQLFSLTFISFDVISGPEFCCSKFSAHFSLWGLHLSDTQKHTHHVHSLHIQFLYSLLLGHSFLQPSAQIFLFFCFLIPIHLGNLLTIIFCTGNPPFEWGLMERPAQKYVTKWISTRILSQASHDVIKQYKMGLFQKGIFVSEELILELIYKCTPPPLWVWAKLTMPGCERRATATLRQYPGSCFQHSRVRDQGREDCDSDPAPSLMKMKSSAKNCFPQAAQSEGGLLNTLIREENMRLSEAPSTASLSTEIQYIHITLILM